MDKMMGGKIPAKPYEIDNLMVVKFMSLPSAIYNSSPKAMYTLLRRNVNKITAALVYDPASEEYHCMVATWNMATRCPQRHVAEVGQDVDGTHKLRPELQIDEDRLHAARDRRRRGGEEEERAHDPKQDSGLSLY